MGWRERSLVLVAVALVAVAFGVACTGLTRTPETRGPGLFLDMPEPPEYNCVTYVSSDIPKSIPDNDPTGITSTLSVTDTDYVAAIEVKLTISHTYVNDLIVYLTSPSTTQVTIINQADTSGDNFVDTALWDDATPSIDDATVDDAPFTGDWGPSGSLGTYLNEDPNGTWTLWARDVSASDTGSIEAWQIKICTDADPIPTEVPPTDTPTPTYTPSPTPTPTSSPSPTPTDWSGWEADNEEAPAGDWDGAYEGTDPGEACSIAQSGTHTEGSYSHEFDLTGGNYTYDECYEWVELGGAKYSHVTMWIREEQSWPDSTEFVPMALAACDGTCIQPWQYGWKSYISIQPSGAIKGWLVKGSTSCSYTTDTSGEQLNLDTWHKVEVQSCQDDSDGYLIVRVDDDEWVAITGVDGSCKNNPSMLMTGRFYGDDAGDYDFFIDDVHWTRGSTCAELVTPSPTPTTSPTPSPTPTDTPVPTTAVPSPSDTPTPGAWVSEVLARPIPTGTPCPDWNLRSGCGLNDSYIEVAVPTAASLADYSIAVYDGISNTLTCQYTYRSDNFTWPLKIIWLDQMDDETGEDVCEQFPITGTVYLYNTADTLIDTRPYTVTTIPGDSWAALVYTDPGGTWADVTPSPGKD